MSTSRILITGCNGQLGKELKCLTSSYPQLEFVFIPKQDLPIHNFELIPNFFNIYKPSFCINCAAYTAVDKAETERDFAFIVNGEAPGVLASVCQEYNTKLIHISTDYVFDGNSSRGYKETDETGPINVYGASKLLGEQLCLQNNRDAVVIRTSWLYSEFGQNFVKTMLRLMKERSSINIVNDQIGAPTYAGDLAKAILTIITSDDWIPGVFHYSNSGKISRFDFALAIRELTNGTCSLNPIPSAQYPTPAERPAFSLLDTTKIQATYNINPPFWKDSLKQCLKRIEELASR